MYYKLLFTSFFLFLFSAQAFSQIDKEFWFAVPYANASNGRAPVYLRFQTFDKAASIKIDIPSNPAVAAQTINIAAANSFSLDVSDLLEMLENGTPNVITNKGLHIVSTSEITVYYELFGSLSFMLGTNCDIFPLKGRNALGLAFFTPFQSRWNNRPGIDAWASFDIVATQDQTHVRITPTKDLVGHPANIPFTIILNRGQTWSGRALNLEAGERPIGTLIVSDKPIAVTIKDDSMQNDRALDMGGDQLIPISKLGTEYIVMKHVLNNQLDNDFAYVLATENNTDIYLSGNTIKDTTLQIGQQLEYSLTEALYIQSSKPIYVLHCTGFGKELAEAILPTLTCTGSKEVGFIRSNSLDFVLNILIKKGHENAFILNGNTNFINASQFTPVKGSAEWMQASLAVSNQDIPALRANLLINTSSYFHLSIMNGEDENTGFRYGYFSDFGFVDLGRDSTICKGDSIELSAGILKDSYLWTPGNQESSSIIVKDSGTYTVTVKKESCELKDTIIISFYPPAIKLLNNTLDSICSGASVVLQANNGFTNYMWSTGSQNNFISVQNAGPYTVSARDVYGCLHNDTSFVVVLPLPQGTIQFSPSDERTFCNSSTSIISLTAPADYSDYLWYNGSSASSIQTNRNTNGLYWVTLTDSLGCERRIELEVDCSTYIEVYNLITLNGDGKNDYFYVDELLPNTYSLEVYNSWGSPIYRNDSYNNEWNMEALLDGVYYYSLVHIKGKRNLTGWFHVVH